MKQQPEEVGSRKFFVVVCLFFQCVRVVMMFLIEVHSILSLQAKYCFFPGWHGLGIVMCPLIF